MSLVMTGAPALEPVTLAEAKTHLRVGSALEDVFIASLITTSRLQVEAILGLALIRRIGHGGSMPGHAAASRFRYHRSAR